MPQPIHQLQPSSEQLERNAHRISVAVFRFIGSLLFFLSFLCHGQEGKEKKSFWANLDSVRNAKIEMGQSLFTPFVAPSFSPELGFVLSGGGLYTFKVEKDNPFLERSALPFAVGYSSNGSLQANVRLTLYGKNDRIRGSGEFWYKKMPDNYFGVGYDAARNVEIGDSTTTYNRKWIQFYYKLVHRVGKHLFWGGILDINRTTAKRTSAFFEADPFVQRFGRISKNAGLGASVQYDSRDLIVNAYKGVYLDLSMVTYGRFFGGVNRYEVLNLDYRQYQNVGRPRRTLAWQMRFRHTFREAPWPELSQLGTPFDLRGYRWGRFRDEVMLFGILEYRHMFSDDPSHEKFSLRNRSGFVTWVGTGSIANTVSRLNQWLPNVGVGYRFETEPRMNIRIDYGIGIDSQFLYVSFNEAF